MQQPAQQHQCIPCQLRTPESMLSMQLHTASGQHCSSVLSVALRIFTQTPLAFIKGLCSALGRFIAWRSLFLL